MAGVPRGYDYSIALYCGATQGRLIHSVALRREVIGHSASAAFCYMVRSIATPLYSLYRADTRGLYGWVVVSGKLILIL